MSAKLKKEVVVFMREKFPVFRGVRPLEVGIRDKLTARLEEMGFPFPKKCACRFLYQWTRRRTYQRCLKVGAKRFSLDMDVIGIVEDSHAAKALQDIACHSPPLRVCFSRLATKPDTGVETR